MLDVKVDLVRDPRAFRGVCGLRAEESGDGYYNERKRDAAKHVCPHCSSSEKCRRGVEEIYTTNVRTSFFFCQPSF